MTREQLARDLIVKGMEILERTGHFDPQTLTAGDLVELSNMIREHVLAAVTLKNDRISNLEQTLDRCLAKIREGDPHYCPHGKSLPSCHECAMEFDDIAPPQASECPHGNPRGDCHACDVASDLAYDSAREDRMFRR